MLRLSETGTVPRHFRRILHCDDRDHDFQLCPMSFSVLDLISLITLQAGLLIYMLMTIKRNYVKDYVKNKIHSMV